MCTPTSTYGTLTLTKAGWQIIAPPHILLRAKRIFERGRKDEAGKLTLGNTPEVCRDLEMFLFRYPLEVKASHLTRLTESANGHRDQIARVRDLLDPNYSPPAIDLAQPLRDYQTRSVALTLASGRLLNADDLGLGKSAQGIGVMTNPQALPAVVVCYPHLQRQWAKEVLKFLPRLRVHVIQSQNPYELPKIGDRGPDVLIITYNKLSSWAATLAEYCRYILFDEIQELRRAETGKREGAVMVASAARFKKGLSATPIYNYGGEIYNVLDVLAPGELGSREEFCREWCTGSDDKAKLKDPAAFGTYLREHGLMLRRTRTEVGRELPPVTKVLHEVNCDTNVLDAVADTAAALAEKILSTEKQEKGVAFQAAGDFDMLMRKATGMAKAPYVAEFVNLLIDSGERVLLGGWHRDVYDAWERKLTKKYGRKVVYYTGTESPGQKERAKAAFLSGEAEVMFISLRSGAGLNELQDVCNTVVIGELDWSPAVHDQLIGRLNRDGQTRGVMAYFLVTDGGSDPIVSEVCGIKHEQAAGAGGPDPGVDRAAGSGAGACEAVGGGVFGEEG